MADGYPQEWVEQNQQENTPNQTNPGKAPTEPSPCFQIKCVSETLDLFGY